MKTVDIRKCSFLFNTLIKGKFSVCRSVHVNGTVNINRKLVEL